MFRDPSGSIWPNFSHSTEEVVILAEGQIEIEVTGQIYRPVIGEEVFIPAQAIHTVHNFRTVPNVWYYGY
ncbi:MAG: cupin domain-containing protein [Synechococcus sp. TMED20]|nr:MAG: cupin domain-containing protein [Synechococcus sp. TMED20]